jgi:hypothetical protein
MKVAVRIPAGANTRSVMTRLHGMSATLSVISCASKKLASE